MRRRIPTPGAGLLAALVVAFALPTAPAAAAFIAEIVSFTPGSGAGFGQDRMPDVVLGPPRGGGEFDGALDVLSLGHGGEIVVRLGGGGACDAPGPDFVVFENAFRIGAAGSAVFVEAGIVAVSGDGIDFVSFPYDPVSFDGLAGRTPVLAHPDNGIDPHDPDSAGGDGFDLADVGVGRALYVRITDPGDAIADPGNMVPPGNSAGFDLDAIAVLHPCAGEVPTQTPSTTATATASATATPTVAGTAVPTSTPTPTVAIPVIPGDANGDTVVGPDDLAQTVSELFDGDGDRVADVGGGTVVSLPGVDANDDGVVSVADLVATVIRLAEP